MKLIIDTNVYISAFAFDKEMLALTSHCLENFEVYNSPKTLAELKSKFFGGRLAKITKDFDLERANLYFETVGQKSKLVWVKIELNHSRDPADNKFLELAKAVQADYLITGDKDLLAIEKFETTTIVKPSEFWYLFPQVLT
jgi:putative PIN family toxin of toxin-antitoxin system